MPNLGTNGSQWRSQERRLAQTPRQQTPVSRDPRQQVGYHEEDAGCVLLEEGDV